MGASIESVHVLRASLGALVGNRARPAEEADAVAGVRPRVVVEPRDEEEVAAVLAFADREGLKVLVRGGGTQLGMGFPPSAGDVLLSTALLDGVVEHNPQDLTVIVRAGMPLAALQERLAQARQWLALDPPLPPAATIGGLVATGASGPRRLRYGGVRDQIIGIRFVTADGTIAKGGGKVVKNVAGYDLPRLFTGSLGTLGVIVSATFRLYPLPVASRTVVLSAPDPAPLCDLAVRTIGTTLVPTALDVAGPTESNGECVCAARFESGEAAAEDQATRLLELAGDLGASARTLRDDEEATFWRQLAVPLSEANGAAQGAALVARASLLPSEMAGWLAQLRDTGAQTGLTTRWRAHAGHGLVFMRLEGAESALVDAVELLRAAAVQRQGSFVVLDAPPALAAGVDMWGPVPAQALMRRLKERFDPNATLNPGRFVGRM